MNVRDNGGSCSRFCEAQGQSCANGWDDETNEQCSLSAPKLGCEHVWEGTSDAICECIGNDQVPGMSIIIIFQ